MTPVRVKGFVVAYDSVADEVVWKVKVNDQTSVHQGKKFRVASCHVGTMLTKRGVDVTFKVEPVRVSGEYELRAVDVAIVSARDNASETESEQSLTINLLIVKDEGQVRVLPTQRTTKEEAQAEHDCDDPSVIAFLRVSRRPNRHSPDVHSILDVIESLLQTDAGWEAIGYLLSAVGVSVSVSGQQT